MTLSTEIGGLFGDLAGGSSAGAIALLLLAFGLWVAVLVHAGRNEAWIWFVVVFVFWPAIVFYPLAMAGQRKTRRMQSNATQRRQARYLELARKAEDLQRELERSRKLAGLSSKPARPDGSPQSG